MPNRRSGSTGIRRRHVQPAVRISPFKFLERPRDADFLFMVEHGEGMVSLGLNRESGGCNDDDAGDFQVHDVPLRRLPCALVSIVFPGFVHILYHEAPTKQN
jgi:hypothetical protein